MAESSTTSETPPPRPSIARMKRSCAALATRRALAAARRLNRAESAAASPDLCQTFDKGRAGKKKLERQKIAPKNFLTL